MNPDGSDVTQVTTLGSSGGYNVFAPTCSPDGTQLMFVSGRNELWLVNVDGSGLTQMTHSSEADPDW